MRPLLSVPVVLGMSLLAVVRAETAVGGPPADPLDRVAAYSLCLGPNGEVRDGWFPIGFVMGETGLPVRMGFNLRDETFRWFGFVDGQPFPALDEPADWRGGRMYSRARGGEVLAISLTRALKTNALPLRTKSYGSLSPALDFHGQPYAKGEPDIFDPAVERFLADYDRDDVLAHRGTPWGGATSFWGLDNEWEGAPDYSPAARGAFAPWLEAAYGGSVETLNRAWGVHYATFAEAAAGKLPGPGDYRTMPAAFLDWWTFQTERFTGLMARLARTVHDADPLHRGVVHKATQQTIEMPGANRERIFDHGAFAEQVRPFSGGLYGADVYGSGDRQAYEVNYLYQCLRPADRSPGYGVMLCEANNSGGPGPQFAATFWRLLANGLKAVDFFTLGFPGAQGDWASLGFRDAATGRPSEKLFYAARWAHAVQRAERFWTESVPAPGLPRVALLMPRRDVLLADPADRGGKQSKWSYPENHRWMLFRWLREQGYWVDIVPYQKLTDEWLASYQGLFLVGAEHLTEREDATVRRYVENGGIVVADARAGRFDAHHLPSALLEPVLGVRIPAEGTGQEVKLNLGGKFLAGTGRVDAVPAGAQALESAADGKPAVFLNRLGKGAALYFAFRLGSLDSGSAADNGPAVALEGPTADNEDYLPVPGEFQTGAWLGKLLARAGLKPSYAVTGEGDAAGKMRVEQPVVDARGNAAVVVAVRGLRKVAENVTGAQVELPLPGGPWTSALGALWAPAENEGMEPVPVEAAEGGRYRLRLPSLASAGVLYLFADHPPLLGIPQIEGTGQAADGLAAQVKPGTPFPIRVQLFNTTGGDLPAGTVRLQAAAGWKVEPALAATSPLPSGGRAEYTFQVVPDPNPARMTPDALYPLVARWSDGKADAAVCSASVEGVPDPAPALLTGNASYPAPYPHRIETGAAYRYLAPDLSQIADPAQGGKGHAGTALLDGFSSRTGTRDSLPFWSDTRHYARYEGANVDILFDLQVPHDVVKAVVVAGPGGNKPARIRILAGSDPERLGPVYDGSFAAPQGDFELPVQAEGARYLRFQIEWAKPGATLDEIELWGR